MWVIYANSLFSSMRGKHASGGGANAKLANQTHTGGHNPRCQIVANDWAELMPK